MSISEADKRRLGFATRCVHAGAAVGPETRAIKRPIVLGNSFKLADTMAELPRAFDWDMPHSYNYPRSRHLAAATRLSRRSRPPGSRKAQNRPRRATASG